MKIYKYIIVINIISLSLFDIAYTEEDKKNKFVSGLDNRFFSIGLYSSADTIKTSVNIEFGFKLFKFNNFEMKSYTSIVGSKIYDENPDMYQLGFMQKFTFGSKDEYTGEISIGRYAFTFVSFGFLSFDPDTSGKFLFSTPMYWEVGGGAGFNINVSRHVAIMLEFGGGLHDVYDGAKLGYPKKLNTAGFGRISIGTRYYIN
ncbi:hypothetical protein BRSU_0400 [Brachyspira suanatina]|uniref:DUF3575 domain-containing protein n=1 Tax=Brachyspira suanatina TaxID=381802 RepID=A0A0G4K498_9SPIR|nr:hypothetical protein [Brachyspira suanatina]CRF31827.1 hypothetical protein BRSU_0400 [Brachyspira suanatina]